MKIIPDIICMQMIITVEMAIGGMDGYSSSQPNEANSLVEDMQA
jgi:hypothetical protein